MPITTANRRSALPQAFTLIELMVVVAIVAILASFGIPAVASPTGQTAYAAHAYQDYIRKTHVKVIQLLRPIQMQIVDNAVNGRPFSEAVQLPTHPWLSSLAIDVPSVVLSANFNPAKFNGASYLLNFVPKDTGPSGNQLYALVGTATNSTIPDGGVFCGRVHSVANLYEAQSCRSAGTTDWSPASMPAKYVPESCKGKAYY